MNNVIIQNAPIADAPCISKVLLDSFIQFKSFYTPEAFAATTVSADEVLKRLKEGNVWVAVKDEHIMGTVAVVKKEDDLYIRGKLSTTPYLPSAIHLYKKFGFEQIGEVDNSFYGTLIFTMKELL